MSRASVTYVKSTHAPLFERYMPNGQFESVGDEGMYGPIDPETGAEYKALGGLDHKYNRDYKVGSSYPKATFVYADGPSGESLTHEELSGLLKEHGLYSDALSRVRLPKGLEHGTATWWEGYIFRPVERGPRIDRVERQLERVVDDEALVYSTGTVVEAPLEMP